MYIKSLDEGLNSLAGDYEYKTKNQQSIINQLQNHLSSIQGYGSFEDTQKYKDLITSYKKDLETTQENAAATGFTQSSKRIRAEQLLSDQNTGLVESGRRSFGYDVSQTTGGISDVQTTMEYLKTKEAQDQIAALRKGESDVGTSLLSTLPNYANYGYIPVGMGGEMKRTEVKSNLDFATNYVF
jgi:hypothetical protein